MGSPQKFVLPSPNFNKKADTPAALKPHFLTPSGMTLHSRHQPPPMYGKRGATYPGKFLKTTQNNRNSTISVAPPAETSDHNDNQFCEACDMELQSMEDMRRHKAQHENCPVDNCNFHGHPSVMDKHVTALHSSGLFEKFKKLSTPEEIAAWREERKRKYPTLENSLMRQKAKEQREKRGERLDANKSRFGKYEDRKRAQDNTKRPPTFQSEKPNQTKNTRHHKNNMHNKRNNNKRRRKEEQQKLEEKKQNEKIENIKSLKQENCPEIQDDRKDEMERSCDGICMFKGTNGFSSYQHLKSKKLKETNVLSSILGMYGSDEDSEEDISENEEDAFGEKHVITSNAESSPENSEAFISNQTTELHSQEELLNDDEVVSECEHLNKINLSLGMYSNENISAVIDANFANTCVNKTGEIMENRKSKKPTDGDINDKIADKSEDKEFDCSDDETPEEAPIARSIDLTIPTKRTQSIKENDSTNNASNQLPPTKPIGTGQVSRFKKQKSGLDYRKARLRKQNTLLEKLLEPDIRHERNVLLQCVRFVCENNFFGIGEKNKN